MAACVRGDEAAWSRFHARFRPVIVHAAERALRRAGVADPADLAQDAASEVIAGLLARDRDALARFEHRSSVETWLRVLARRAAGHLLRRRRPGALDEPALVTSRETSPADAAQERERARLVRAELETLAPRDLLALQLFYEGDRSYAEVGTALGVPASRIGTLLARARARLAKSLGLRFPG